MTDKNSTYVSFYLRDNTIRIFKSTIRFLGTPEFVQFRVHYDGSSMILEPHSVRTFTTLRVPKNIYNENGSMEVHSKGLCRILANRLGWDVSSSYRIPGKLIPRQKIVVFDLTSATIIPPNNNTSTISYIRDER